MNPIKVAELVSSIRNDEPKTKIFQDSLLQSKRKQGKGNFGLEFVEWCYVVDIM